MKLHRGSAITLTLLASSLQLVTATIQGQVDYSDQVAGYPPRPRPGYPKEPAHQAPPRAPAQAAPPTKPSPSARPSQRPAPQAAQKSPPKPAKPSANEAQAQPPPSNGTQASAEASSGKPEDGPQLNVDDPRFMNFKPAGEGDSRSACPGLNALSNHGFLPHNGKQMNASDIVLACFHGLGISPETCSIIVLSGLEASDNDFNFVFDLEDVDLESWEIEHDCSFSRKDNAEGDGEKFNKRNWDVAVDALNNCQKDGKISARCLGSARAARIKDQKKINPKTNYNDKAAGHGAVEVARMILTLGNKQDGADLKFIKSVFEEEKLPAHLGWKPQPYVAGVHDVLDLAEDSQKADPETLGSTSDGDVSNKIDILTTLKSSRKNFLQEVKKLCVKSGFRKASIYESLQKLNEQVRERFGEDFEVPIDANPDSDS